MTTINYTIAPSPLGMLLVAATERGVSKISLGDSETALEQDLRAEFPQAEISRADAALATNVAEIIAYLRGEQPSLRLPLDVRATAFQHQVWEALRRIPYGSTVSYGQLAAQIGRPTAARAVARACATNPAALVIPCHRVVREDGHLGGYRWGIERKEQLLAAEHAHAEAA